MESGKGANVDDEQELGLKILTLHAEQESNVMAVKTFNVPVDFPFDVSDKTFEIMYNEDMFSDSAAYDVNPGHGGHSASTNNFYSSTSSTLNNSTPGRSRTSELFNTTRAGTHNLVYGLYKEARLVVCGSMAFDVGDAVLMGITTDHFEYKQGSEPVNVKIDYFGEGTAQIELYLDEEKMDERSVTLNGVGSTGISLNSSSVSGGFHSIKAVLTKDGLTSVKTTGFIYGPNLPDLVVAF